MKVKDLILRGQELKEAEGVLDTPEKVRKLIERLVRDTENDFDEYYRARRAAFELAASRFLD